MLLKKSIVAVKYRINLDDLTDYERELFEERAAIMEFDGGLERSEAERKALAEVIRRREAK